MPYQDVANDAIEKIEEVTGLDPTMAAIALIVLVIIAVVIFTKPLRFIVKILINTAVGVLAMILINKFGAQYGLAIDVTWLTAGVTGVLGIPGVVLLLVLKWMGVM